MTGVLSRRRDVHHLHTFRAAASRRELDPGLRQKVTPRTRPRDGNL